MTDESPTDDGSVELDQAVERFLDDVESTLEEYDRGYADADATLQVLRSHLSTLREDVEE